MLLKRSIFLLYFVLSFEPAFAEQNVYSSFDSIISSESVPINDMLTGWENSYQRGEIVFADVNWSFGFSSDLEIAGESFGQLSVQREYRRYYYLNYDKETSDYFRALELGNELTSNKKLDLTFKQFEAPGITFGYESKKFQMESINWQLGLGMSLYQPGHFQFGSIKGIAEAGEASAASGIINYRYDDDKLLDHRAEVDKGLGLSLSLMFALELEQWRARVSVKDIINRFRWRNSAFTKGCINVGGGSRAQCDADGAASGISAQGEVVETIPYTLNAKLSHLNSGLIAYGMAHDEYYRLGLEKGVQTSLGRFAFFLYYPRLAGLSWQASIFNIQLGADTLKLSQARNLQLNMGINWRW